MQNQTAVKIVERKMIDALTSKWLLKRLKLSKIEILGQIHSEAWRKQAAAVLEKDKISCSDVLMVCEKVLESFSETPKDGWLQYIYKDVLASLFPDTFPFIAVPEYERGKLLYLEVVRIFLQYEQENHPFDPKLHFRFPVSDDVEGDAAKEEFMKLQKLLREKYFYEFMRIGTELSRHKTLAHISGVHYIAMHIASQLKRVGIPVDLALISGAAMGHDIGKFGCRPEEEKRIPYLHYYYTDHFFKRNGMPNIGHIATNHSTWDLELENLSVESLILIYADFRVKGVRDQDGKESIHFFSLRDSFEIILNKLDNVNEAKKDRYTKVYAKLTDFEDYMVHLGVNVDLTSDVIVKIEKRDPALMNPEEVIRDLKFLAIRHNIFLMHKFNSEISFGNLLEAARSETNWKNMRAYISIFQEYFTYMTQKQKLMTLRFLYEQLMNKEGDIRRQSAELLGNIIVHFDEEYRKELPEGVQRRINGISSLELWEKYLEEIILPDHRVADHHKRWLGYTLKIISASVFNRCKQKDVPVYLNVMLSYYFVDSEDLEDSAAFILLDALLSLPLDICRVTDIATPVKFAIKLAARDSMEIQIAALRFFCYLSECPSFHELCYEMFPAVKQVGSNDVTAIRYLKNKMKRNLRIPLDQEKTKKRNAENKEITSEIFLENLKAATPWVIKSVNIELLMEQIKSGSHQQALQIAAHFSNLVKVSERVTVRHSAGEALVVLAPYLSLDQRNEIAVELTKGLELGQYEFSKYIPDYLGQFALYLHPNELDELITNFKKLLESTNEQVGSVTLDTLGILLLHYPSYRQRFPESSHAYVKRREMILGLILKGLSHYQEVWNQEAFLVIGQYLFGTELLSLQEKYELFQVVYKKILTMIIDRKETALSFFNSASSLNHIYRFLSNYSFYYGAMRIKVPERVAFFSGTFDPFSASHARIASEIRNMGFEVYLSIDEFFWSKRMQPKLMRRRIALMSVASEKDVYLFPDDIPVSFANPHDLRTLREQFPKREVFIVIGSDVLQAAAYLAAPEESSIHSFSHVIIKRGSVRQSGSETGNEGCQLFKTEEKNYSMILGKVIEFSLPSQLEELSSSHIRVNIDENRDVSNLVDPLAQQYINEYGLYLREPQFKQVLKGSTVQVFVAERMDGALLSELDRKVLRHYKNQSQIEQFLQKEDVSTIIIRDGGAENAVAGIAAFYRFDKARQDCPAGSVVITGLMVSGEGPFSNMEQIVLTEALAFFLQHNVTCAIYHDEFGTMTQNTIATLQRQGFLKSERLTGGICYEVDMSRPVALIDDMLTLIKEPLSNNERVRNVIREAHQRFQSALVNLYPGSLILSFDSQVMQLRMGDIIAKENEESGSAEGGGPGRSMCVPFGKILRGIAVPNTVTMSLHTEKVFEPEINRFQIREFPNYSPLRSQIRTIQSFRLPVLLVDDLLHTGYRMRGLDPILRQENLEVRKLVVGILSKRGEDLMNEQGRRVDCVYSIPNMLSWFSESSMYPYLGGDSVRREGNGSSGLLPSINMVLPYVAPRFLLYVPKESIYDFSMTCLQNTKNILTTLEQEYQMMFERNLTLNRLSEAVLSPRCPDKGANISYDCRLAPSVYIADDIEKLVRLENVFL